jgi:hypothetical protein
MQAITWYVPAAGFANDVLSSVSTKPLSPETVVPSGITTVTIMSTGPS